MNQVFTGQVPGAIGPYSQAIRIGDLLFCSGQTPVEPVSMSIEKTGIEDQTKRVIENLRAVLHSRGLTLADVVKTTVFITDMTHFDAMNRAYAGQFDGHRPARTTVAVKGLPLDALVEIECIASFTERSSSL